jgi:hypothetical protein
MYTTSNFKTVLEPTNNSILKINTYSIQTKGVITIISIKVYNINLLPFPIPPITQEDGKGFFDGNN